jgi:flagellin
MSNQVRGMSQANRNAQDANNLLATAESGLSDISDVLSKMRELSVQAATDTLNDNDRSSIDLEFQSLKDELTRIANVTEYNGMNVLNGTYQDSSDTGNWSETWYGNGPNSLFNANSSSSNPGALDYYDQSQPGTSGGSSKPHGNAGGSSINVDGPDDNSRGHWRLQIGADNDINNQHEFSVRNATAKWLGLNHPTYSDNYHSYNLAQFTDAIKSGNFLEDSLWVDKSTGAISFNPASTAGLNEIEWDATTEVLEVDDVAIVSIGTNDAGNWVVSDAAIDSAGSSLGGTVTTVLSDANTYDEAFDTTVGVHDVNVRDVQEARRAVTHLDHAIDEINRERSYIGSEQNKLQFTMSNLSSNIQSIESARSSIEDVDFAAEAADLAKNQILAQSGTAMLAQASAISQNILGLLA